MNIVHLKNLPKTFCISDFISNQFENWVIDIEFIYGSNFKNTKLLRDFVEEIFFYLWLWSEDVIKIILIVDELNNNAIEYWTEKWWYNKMRLKCSKDGEQIDINIEVEDTGNWAKHKNSLEMETLRAHQLKLWYNDHKSIRGRWLFMIIVKTVDRLYFRDTDNWWLIVWIKKRIKK
jgi:anti-sigma regulatory factor (Ser/Thr protein kinase)